MYNNYEERIELLNSQLVSEYKKNDELENENKELQQENIQLKAKLIKIETLIMNHNWDRGDIYYKYNGRYLKSELKEILLEILKGE